MKEINTAAKKGFTLAELLAVVIIVGLLASLAVGYYKKSVEQSHFSEGLIGVATIVESINQAYLDDIAEGIKPVDAAKLRKIRTLPSNMSNSRSCDLDGYCVATKHFEIWNNEGSTNGSVVRAYRGTKSTHRYYLEGHANYASEMKDQITCVGSQNGKIEDDAKAFCESMGYTKCEGSLTTSCSDSACSTGVCLKL